MSQEMLTILRPDGKLKTGQKAPPIPPQELLRLYRLMLLNRRLDERMIILQRQGRIGFYVGSAGEEAAIIGSSYALEKKDWIVPCYREVGPLLLRGVPLLELAHHLFGNAEDAVKGRQMPCHYAFRQVRFCSVSSPVSTQIPHAVGLGLAARLRGQPDIALVYFGDGATSGGDFHAGLNFAGVFKTPTVFFCRNNQWAISLPLKLQTASETLAIKAKAYGFDGVLVDGNDIFAVYVSTRAAVEKARRGEGPTLIEAVTYRQGAHSTSDDPRGYRAEKEVKQWENKDPLTRFKVYLLAAGYWSEQEDERLEKQLKDEIQDALKKAEKIAPPPLETIFEDVFDIQPWHLREQSTALLQPAEMRS